MDTKILLVEDDEPLRRMVDEFLRKEGYDVALARDAQEGLESFRRGRPNLVLLDVGLPGGDGFSLCRSMRKEAGEEMPILFLTCWNDMENRTMGFSAGAQDYIPKPFSLQELIARIENHLRPRRSLEELARQKRDLEVRERARQDMMDMIVHDLKAPLSSLSVTLEIIRSHGIINDNQYNALLATSQTTAGMMLIMLNDMLDMTRAEQSNLKPVIAPVDMQEVLKKLESLFILTYERRQLRLRMTLRMKDTMFITDQQLLFRIMANLLSNAMKFSPRGEEVAVNCAEAGSTLRLIVADRGGGVPDEEKKRIFEKFVQLKSQPLDLDRGSGIGLAFCQVATQALGGSIRVEDRQGGGCQFVLELPR